MKKKLLTLLLALLVMFSATVALIPNTVNKAKASDTNNVVVTKLNSEEKTDTKKNKIRYVQEKDMTRTGSFEQGSGIFTTYYTYETIVTVNEGDTIDYCFKFLTWQDREGWINNENNDYHVKVDSSNVPCSYTVEYDKLYPEYDFASNKGYGSAKHIEALKKYGPCPIHRMSFIQNFIK